MAHVFVSYSHKDKEYAHKLADELRKWDIDAWLDDRIDYGEEWPKVIQEQLDECSGFIVIMSKNAYESKWVHNEVTRADRKKKHFFPLLLQGETWIQMEATQYVDVRNGEMPPDSYFEVIKKRLGFQEPQTQPKFTFRPSKHLSDTERLHQLIVEAISFSITWSLDQAWDIGLFRIALFCPRTIPFINLPQRYHLINAIITAELLSRYDTKTYLSNKEDFDKFTSTSSITKEMFSPDSLIVPIISMPEFDFRRRTRLHLINLESETAFTTAEIEEFAKQLIDIHTAHHIPINEIEMKAVKL